MIRIDLVDNTTSVKHIDFQVVPVTKAEEFTCSPDGLLPFHAVMRLSRKVKAGGVFGQMGKYLWYRVKEAPTSKHENQFASHP